LPRVECVGCRWTAEIDDLSPSCKRCGSAVLLANPTKRAVSRERLEKLPPGVWRYRDFLPEVASEEVVTLGEGATPLLHAQRLGEAIGLKHLLLKDESRNPTGSFLDRGATVLLTVARRRGVKECACVTTGNLGASLSAYCAKAGVKAHVYVSPRTDQGKLFQMLAYGAEIDGTSPSKSWQIDHTVLNVTAGNPYLLEGEKTTGFELVQELGWCAPDVVVVPVGTGGHLSMIWRSLVELRAEGIIEGSGCRLLGARIQEAPSGSSKKSGRASESRLPSFSELSESEPFFLEEAERSMVRSGGKEVATTAKEAMEATSLLARTEGIFAEPSSASVVASLAEAVRSGKVDKDEKVVCVITGAGLKDTRAVVRLARQTRTIALREGFATRSPTIGETKLAILRLLERRPRYGYELWLLLGAKRRIATASVYQHLAELEGMSIVRRRGPAVFKGRERMLYELTKKGDDFLEMMGKLEN